MDTIWAQEADGRTVRDPITMQRLDRPTRIDRADTYWFRRLQDGDLVEVPAPAEGETVTSAAETTSRSRRTGASGE